MKKLYILLLLSLGFQPFLWSQVAVNSNNVPNGNLLVRPSGYANPDNKSGVLIPRVESLAATATDGMIVYLGNPNPQDTEEPNGFYYWDAPLQKWIPFITRHSSLLEPPSVFYAGGTSFMNQPYDCITDIGTADVKPADRILLSSFSTNNEELCKITPEGCLEIKKSGQYYIQISTTLTKATTPPGIRDILNIQLQKRNPDNGLYETITLGPENDIKFEGASSFPGQVINAGGNNVTGQSQTITSQGAIRLEVGDIISLSCGITYSDPVGQTTNNNNVNRTSAKYTITANTDASIAGRYMGYF
ncbi:hypothetical protein [Dysgonomonas sp.]